ncbi:MAG TPA: hypothetical protein VGO58_03615 [Chitinophagaceae bacterium]|jgi:hypothetical protein|nr:hypothetical protein [Chitinophagaceae bacterium]
MATPTNVPLTIQTGIDNSYPSRIVFGSNNLEQDYSLTNLYWALVIDRANLNIIQNFTFSDNQTSPAQLQPYLNNSQYILILTTQGIASTNLPAGAFYKMLIGIGAGPGLRRLEQIFAALNCGTWGRMGYTLVTVMDTTEGIEYAEISEIAAVSTLQFIPVQIGTGVLYTPSPL